MKEYSHINYAVVLACMPDEQNRNEDHSDKMLPEGIESVHPHYTISWRNNWMLKQSDYVVTYLPAPVAVLISKFKRQKHMKNLGQLGSAA